MRPERPTVGARIRRWLGTDRILNLEATMATVVDALKSLVAQQADVSAEQAATFANMQHAIDRLQESVTLLGQGGEVSAPIQDAINELSAGFAAMKAAAQAADDNLPAEGEPAAGEPVPGEPTDNG